jgi:hypothetical protein
MESPGRGDAHAGFGGRPRETDQEQSRRRARGRLDISSDLGDASNPLEDDDQQLRPRQFSDLP